MESLRSAVEPQHSNGNHTEDNVDNVVARNGKWVLDDLGAVRKNDACRAIDQNSKEQKVNPHVGAKHTELKQ